MYCSWDALDEPDGKNVSLWHMVEGRSLLRRDVLDDTELEDLGFGREGFLRGAFRFSKHCTALIHDRSTRTVDL